MAYPGNRRASDRTSYVINKASHRPIEQQREYLILALKCERKGSPRSREISKALRNMTTKVVQKQNREAHHERA